MKKDEINIEQLELETQGRYQFKKLLGRGAYGIVFSAKDRKTGKMVAVKKIENIFESKLDAKRCLREVSVLSRLQHDNITNLISITTVDNPNKFDCLYLIMDLMEADLYSIINSRQSINIDHHRFFIYQVLRGLKFLHSANVLHRDLKPSNLLVNANCDLKIADFGLARITVPGKDANFLTEYVATRWYRPPEVLMNYETYGPELDVWSVGCILGELILGKPLFPGRSSLNQISLIVNTLGTPSDEDLNKCPCAKARDYVRGLPKKEKVPWERLFRGHLYRSDELDVLEKMLSWEPSKRITVQEALEHPFFESLHDPLEEPVTFPIDNFEFERENIHMSELKNRIWSEVLKYHPEFQKTKYGTQ